MVFVRRYTSDPGDTEILAIEGVVIIDQAPPGAINGVGSGFVCCIAEMEDGPFGIPVEVASNTDLASTFGSFGFIYGSTPAHHACARSRHADNQLNPEFWNGNGYIALVNKRFSRLAIVRVDTSVGSVSFTPIAFVTGNGNFEWALSPGQTLALDLGAGPVVATFNAAAATKASGTGSYPTTFAGGEHIQFVIDAGTPQQIGPVDVFFQAADQSQAQVVARLNAAAGYAAFSVGGGNVTNFSGRVQGLSGNVQILAQDSIVGTKLGFNTTVQAGTGNVQDISKVKFTEVQSIVQGAIAGTTVDRDFNNNLRISAAAAASITVATSSTALALGFVNGFVASNAPSANTVIPAGTRVRNGSAVEWVTCQTIAVTAGSLGPYSAKVRPAVDDGTNAGTVAGSANLLPFAVPGGNYSVINNLPLAPALTEAALDAAYVIAMNATLSSNTVTRECNVIISARASNAIRTNLRSNAQQASFQLFGRVTCVRPPLGTTRANARSAVTQPGVGAYRDERLIYNFPGFNTFVPLIAERGLSGGAGFTADGNIDVGSDTWCSSVLSQLNPEDNPGQLTSFMQLANSLEVNNPDVQSMGLTDYELFKAAGICAPIIDNGDAVFQSGVTSVDPLVSPGLVPINRRRMADYIEDSLAIAMKPYSKKLATRSRRAEVYGIVNDFLNGLVGNQNQSNQRIDSFSLDAKSGNPPTSLAKGIYRLIINVRLVPDMLDIVLQVTVGVDVDTSAQVVQLAA